MTYLRHVVVLFLAAALLLLAACSKKEPSSSGAPLNSSAVGDSDSRTPDNLPHPCTLVTVADAEAILGPGAKIVRNSDTECDIDAQNLRDGGISIKIEPAPEDFAGDKEVTMKLDKDAKSVSGIGDGAYTFMGGLIFVKGKAQVNVIGSAYRSKVMPHDSAVEYIAKKVIAKL